MPTVAERLATLEAKFEDLEKRMNGNGSWMRFLIAQAIQAILLGATVIVAMAAWRHSGP